MSDQENPALAAVYPFPPQYYKLYSDERIARFNRLKDASVERVELEQQGNIDALGAFIPVAEETLDPPEPVEGIYQMFGQQYTTAEKLPSLTQQGIPQLFPDGPIDRVAELRNMNHSLLLNFLELVDIMSTEPDAAKFEHKFNHIRLLLINFHHLLNEYRPHEARDIIRLMLERQIRRRKSNFDAIWKVCNEVQQLLNKPLEQLQTLEDLSHN
ncbi:mediator complex, subunit Med7 [Cladochytrium replicatum]|nr:mediator complex, subunit Med7 [Cladochytrium replicatum]